MLLQRDRLRLESSGQRKAAKPVSVMPEQYDKLRKVSKGK
jgi:hypothetical protein